MYYTSLPDDTAADFDGTAHYNSFKHHNIVFNAAVRNSHCDDHVGVLSLKTCFSGEEWYYVNKVPYAVRKDQFLILNQDQHYGSHIDSDKPVQSCSLFFKPAFGTAILQGVMRSEEKLTDDPFYGADKPELYQKLYHTDAYLKPMIQQLLRQLDLEGYTPTAADEKLAQILHHLILLNGREDRFVRNIDALKYATRTEIYRRLCIAKDVMHSCYSNTLTLEEICRYAGLSLPQLIRQFKNAFGITPHQYLTDVRIQQAAHLLRTTSLSVKDITIATGFMDASAFCRVFKKYTRHSPELFRQRQLQ